MSCFMQVFISIFCCEKFEMRFFNFCAYHVVFLPRFFIGYWILIQGRISIQPSFIFPVPVPDENIEIQFELLIYPQFQQVFSNPVA